jgi:hypothetical protein
VGVPNTDGRIQGHAWLEINGVSLDPAGSASHLTFEPIRGGEVQ